MQWGWLLLSFYSNAWGHAWNVFGPDDRVVLRGPRWPVASIGQVRGGPECSGTLVGSQLVLTAAHCAALTDGHLDPNRPIHFLAQVSNGRSAAVHRSRALQAWAGKWQSESDSRAEDWAILLLDAPPRRRGGEGFPWLEVREAVVAPVAGAGYSEDFQKGLSPSIDPDCLIRESFPEGFFFHDCGNYAGASGGPILQEVADNGSKRVVVVGVTNAHFSDGAPGLHLDRYTPDRANVGASAKAFLPTLLQLKISYPDLP